ncbi:MAG: sugar transferase, partial [Actinomycetota bacterium]
THTVRRPPVLEDPRLVPGIVEPQLEREDPKIPSTLPQKPLQPAAPERPASPARSAPSRRRPRQRIAVSTDATAPLLEPLDAPAEPSRPRPIAVVTPPEPEPSRAPTSVGEPHVVPDKPLFEAIKRVIDMGVAAAVLVLGAPLWLLVACAIKLDSRGPVLFKGIVWGKECEPFLYYKFRSMRVDGADDGHRRFIQDYVRSGTGVAHGEKTVFKYVGDPRITRIGRLIRKFSIDEIPQLVNVLRGEMSLVGPRPPLQYEFELYDDEAKKRLSVRPGMTGLQQTYARHSASFAEKVEMDLAYIRDRSLRLDLAILLKTIPAAFKGE